MVEKIHVNRSIDARCDESRRTIKCFWEKMEEMKNDILETLQNLSAIAEENSATTEQVTASLEEQTASVEEIANANEELSTLAQNLQSIIMKFKI